MTREYTRMKGQGKSRRERRSSLFGRYALRRSQFGISDSQDRPCKMSQANARRANGPSSHRFRSYLLIFSASYLSGTHHPFLPSLLLIFLVSSLLILRSSFSPAVKPSHRITVIQSNRHTVSPSHRFTASSLLPFLSSQLLMLSPPLILKPRFDLPREQRRQFLRFLEHPQLLGPNSYHLYDHFHPPKRRGFAAWI